MATFARRTPAFSFQMNFNFKKILADSLAAGHFQKMTLSRPIGQAEGLKNLLFRPVLIKKREKIQATFRFSTRDEFKNWSADELLDLIEKDLGTGWLNADLLLADREVHFQTMKNGHGKLTEKKLAAATETKPKPASHDHEKTRLLDPASPWLAALGIASGQGEILKSSQDKWRQINKFLEIVQSLLKQARPVAGKPFRVADMGSGKGYLTFALYDFLKNTLGLDAQVTGVELRGGLVDFCNQTAQSVGFQQLKFEKEDIAAFQPGPLDLLIALHACDTATDLAIASGLRSEARAIVVAPCCHKQVRRDMAAKNELAPILKNGILEERQAEILTDGIRALLLEKEGYRTQVFEFISTEHTAKNVMITAVRAKPNPSAAAQIDALKSAFGLERHFLETLI